jgi:hypothetical protein
MPDHAVALVLTAAEAEALFVTVNVGLIRRAELGRPAPDRAVEAVKKIARGMGCGTRMDGPMVLLVSPIAE